MLQSQAKRYVESLMKTIQNNYQYLKETLEDFREMCLMVTPERNVPSDIIRDIRQTYKEMQNRLGEIKAIEQLIQGKYRQYYRRDPLFDKEILEFRFLAKSCFTKFESTLMQKKAQEKTKEILREDKQVLEEDEKSVFFRWFRSEDNQVTFIKNLRILSELDYEIPPNSRLAEKREVNQNRPRSLTLFVFSGDEKSIDELHARIRLREHDIVERFDRDELHGLLTHLREIPPLEVERIFRGLLEKGGFSKLKCFLCSIHSPKDLEKDLFGLTKKTLQQMTEGEIKLISI
jgi:hypothetical protein